MEITITPTPAQPLAEMVSVKAGRRNSKSDEQAIREAIALLEGVLDDEESDDGEDNVKANGAPEEPEQSNPKKDALLEIINKILEENES